MNLNEAKKILKNAGYIVENAISFEQEAENIVNSYGTDKFGLDAELIVEIMKYASKFKDKSKQVDFITKQFKIMTGLTIWDIQDDKNLKMALIDICNAVFKNTNE